MADWLTGEPTVIVAGDGPYLIDAAGNRYLDGTASMWCNVHGHRHPVIDAAIREQLGKIAHSTFLGLTNEPATLLAEQLIRRAAEEMPSAKCQVPNQWSVVSGQWPAKTGASNTGHSSLDTRHSALGTPSSPDPRPPTPDPRSPLSRVFYSDSGATACEIAAKIAFHYWQLRGEPKRTKFVSFSLGYHGDTIGMVSLGGIDLFHAIYRPLLFAALHAPPAYCYRCELDACPMQTAPNGKPTPPFSRTTEGRRASDRPCLRAVEKLLTDNPGQVAAVFVEPLIQGAAGVITSPPGYLAGLREITRRHDVLLVADEVAVGFGRTGTMFACQQEGVTPDLMCLAKGITGGYLPLAATLVSEQVFEPFNQPGVTFFHGHTYTGNPLAAAAGLASLRVFDDERVIENLPPKIARFAERLDRLWRFENVGDIRVRGLFAGVELVADRATKNGFVYEDRTGRAVCDAARRLGLFIRPLGDVLVFIPPLCVTVEQIDEMFDAVEAAMEEVLVIREIRG